MLSKESTDDIRSFEKFWISMNHTKMQKMTYLLNIFYKEDSDNDHLMVIMLFTRSLWC
jgi:hypothetical protein